MSNINFLGAASGLPLEELVSTFVKTERDLKIGRLNANKKQLDASLSGVAKLKSALAAFQDASKKLSSENLSKRSVNITQPVEGKNFISATAGNTASAASFSIKVNQVATGSRLESADMSFNAASDVISSTDGTLTFTAGTKSFDINVTAGMTLDELRLKINDEASNFGVNANIVNAGGTIGTKLVLSSNESGVGNDLIITNNNAELDVLSTVPTGSSAGVSSVQSAQSAIVEVDGITIQSATNTLTNAIQDVTLTVVDVTPDGANAVVNVETDKKLVKENIENFIKSYNELFDQMAALTRGRILGEDGESVTLEAGALRGDPLPRSIGDRLRSILGGANTDAIPELSTLFSIGITFSKEGKLEISTSNQFGETGTQKFERALNENFDDLATLFGSPNGLVNKLDTFITEFNQSGGIFSSRETGIREQLKNNSKAIDDANRYMAQYEDTLRKRYQALDSLMAQLQSTSTYVTAQLGSLPGFGVKK